MPWSKDKDTGVPKASSIPVEEEPALTPEVPIIEHEKEISYLGVRVPKAENPKSAFVPKREQYEDYINDPELSLPLQRDIAVAFLQGEPLLIEGGTSLGKTTTIRKMAAELGYEVHYANLNGATDVEDLMGRYIPNPGKATSNDPEYLFADGKVTSGLRQEQGKRKVIILDEFNAAGPGILIRLHEVIDALERNGDVVLSEDASETLQTSRENTKIVALMNPPGKGYFSREPLDPALLRRWIYKKLPSELPKATFDMATDSLFGLEGEIKEAELKMFSSREAALSPEQLVEIPGIQEILEKYKEFHQASKKLVSERKVAQDQPQPFTFDDRMEPRRVRDFILTFYHGDINETMQNALRYYYANKMETDEDRKKMEELITTVAYIPATEASKRRGLSGSKETEKKKEVTKKEGLRPAEKIAENVYRLPLDYGKKWEDMLKEGAFDWVNDNITKEHFPIEGKDAKNVVVEALHFDKVISTADVLKEMEKRKLKPAKLEHILALAKHFPDLQREYPIIELESAWVDPDGSRYVASLDRSGSKRELGLNWGYPDDEWREYCRFLAVRNEE